MLKEKADALPPESPPLGPAQSLGCSAVGSRPQTAAQGLVVGELAEHRDAGQLVLEVSSIFVIGDLAARFCGQRVVVGHRLRVTGYRMRPRQCLVREREVVVADALGLAELKTTPAVVDRWLAAAQDCVHP